MFSVGVGEMGCRSRFCHRPLSKSSLLSSLLVVVPVKVVIVVIPKKGGWSGRDFHYLNWQWKKQPDGMPLIRRSSPTAPI